MMSVDFMNVFYGGHDMENFNAQLFKLIAKADDGNLYLLSKGYPVQVAIFRWWMSQEELPTRGQVEEQIERIEAEHR